MKKFFCCLGLFFGGFVVNILLAYLLLALTIFLFILFFPVAVFLDILILIMAVVCTIFIIKLSRKKLNISAPVFIALYQLPTAVLSTAYFIFIKFNGFLFNILNDSEMEYILTLATSISSTIILYLTVITCLVIYIVRKVSEKRNSKLELNSI